MGDLQPGDDLATLLLAALRRRELRPETGDVLVVTQKVISKAEGRLVRLSDVVPSTFARTLSEQGHKSPAYYEVVLRESRRIVRMQRGVLITETYHGFICANAGVDESNIGGEQIVALLPEDPDQSAAALRAALRERTGVDVAVIISDSFGRPWREGQINVAIGAAGIEPLVNYAGVRDVYGYPLQASVLAVADELASAAELVMGKIDRVPVVLVRGYDYTPAESNARQLLRDPGMDLFR
jgi:coenzyme F420-0:L-glutamate ligase/coenzyme F420-1:gamma-L-glutamate ligase